MVRVQKRKSRKRDNKKEYMCQCISTEDQTKQTQYVLREDYSIICMLIGTEFLIQDGLLENFLHYTRRWSHVPGCVSHSLCRSALFNAPLPPMPASCSPLFLLQNMPPADIFSLKKWPILSTFFKAISFLFFLPDCYFGI